MINEPALRNALLALAEHVKKDYVILSSTLNEVAALRETVRGLDPTFSEVLEDKGRQSQEETREVVSLTVALLNDLVARLKAGAVC